MRWPALPAFTLFLLALVATRVATADPDSTGSRVATPAAATSSTTVGDSIVRERPHGLEDYIAQVRADFTHENKVYSSIRSTLGFLDPLYEIAVALLLLFAGISARMRDVAHARFKGRYGRVLLYVAIYSVVDFLFSLPLSWYRDFSLEHRFGLSNQTFGSWVGEEAKSLVVGIIVIGGTGLLALAYRAIARSPRRWWLWLGLGTLPVIVAGSLLEPLVIDPLFNKFTPLRDQHLEAEILSLASKAEIPGRHVYQVDKSKQTKKYNAYVSGFGSSQRIVLWDTTLRGMKDDEILFVMGHEMGHYRLGHIWKGIALFTLLSFGLYYFSWRTMSWAVRRFGDRWGFHQLDDVASLPLLGITLTIALFIVQPAVNTYTRAVEHEADGFSIELTHRNDAGARAFIKLGSQNRADPEPPAIIKFFQYSHPPLVERIRFAMTYRPWEENRPNRFFKAHGSS